MPWILNDAEFKSVGSLPAPKRYSYSIKKIADQKKVWSLYGDGGWILASDERGRQLVPIWPHERFATVCIKGLWAGASPKVIELDLWMKRWLPGIEREGRGVAVFESQSDKAVIVEASRLRDDLENELSNYSNF